MNTKEHEWDRLRAALVPPFRLSLYGASVPRRAKVWQRPVFIRVYSCPFVVEVNSYGLEGRGPLMEDIGDKAPLCFAVFDWILDAHSKNRPLSLFIAVPQFRTGAECLSERHQFAVFVRAESDDMGMNPK